MSDDLINPDGSIRQIAHMHPNINTPFTHSPQYPSGHQQTSRTHHHRPHPHETYSYSRPVPAPVPTTSNTMRMRHANYPNRTVQETFQHRISINSIPRGSHVFPVRVPTPPVRTRSVITRFPHVTPPPVLIPKPVPFLPSPLENLEAEVSVPAFNQHEQNKNEGEGVEIEQVLVNYNKAEIMHSYTALGQAIYLIHSSLEDQTEKVKSSHKAENELRAKNEVLNDLKKDLEQEVVDIRNEKEEVVKKAAEDVQQAKSEEAIWRNKFIELNDQLTTLKNESEEKDNNIRVLIEKRFHAEIVEVQKEAELIVQRAKSEESIWRNKFTELNEKHTALKKESDEKDNNIRELKEKDTDNETKITQLEAKVLIFEMSERKLKKEELECLSKRVVQGEMRINELEEKVCDLESSERKFKEKLGDKDKCIKILERKHEKKCEQFIKMTTTKKELNIKIRNFVQKEKVNEVAMQELETNFKLRVQELEAKISEKTNENTNICNELEKERKDNQVDREKINEQMGDLYERVRVLQRGDSVNVQKLKTEREKLQFKVKELEETILKRNSEFYKISQDLKEKKNDNELIVNEVKKKSKMITDLKDDLKSIQKKNDDLLYKFEIILNAVKSPVLPEDPKKQHEQTVSCLSPSSENETFPGSSSSSITKDGYNENVGNSRRSVVELLELEDSSKFSLNNKLGKRKHSPSIKSSAAKKQRQDDHNGRQNKLINFPEISHAHFNQESNTEGGTEIPEMSITSRSTRSSTGRRQRKHK